MATFDSSALLTIPGATDATKGITQGLQLKDLMDEGQMRSIQLKQAKEQEQEQEAQKSLLKDVNWEDPNSVAKGLQSLSKAGYGDAVLPLLTQYQKVQSGQFETQKAKTDLQISQNEVKGQFLDTIGTNATDLLNMMTQSKDPAQGFAQARAEFMKRMPVILQQLPQDQPWAAQVRQTLVGFANSPGLNDPAKFKQALMTEIQQSNQGRAILQKQQADALAQRKETTEEAREQTGERREDTMERALTEKEQGGQGKAPVGFEWDPKTPGNLIPIPGGPKDPASSNMSGRQAVYFTRVAAAGNEAALAIKNIAGLPVGASSGVFGVGRTPGESLFGAAKGALTNSLSSQNVQDYNTMLAGIKRNLATIESAGMAPGGSMTDSMGSLELRAGDTGLTKLRKMAEMRQIIERGLEVNLSDPRVPSPQKDLVRKITSEVAGAVPFTQQDVTDLEAAQTKNPKMTLADLMKQRGLTGSAQPATGGGTSAAGQQAPLTTGAPAAAAPVAPKAAPAPGTVEQGYKFLGGNPADPKSWQQVQ